MDHLDGIRTFIAVVESGSFTAAADRLGMSKKLASKYVVELESRLGVRLLNRTTRSMSPTEAGQIYYHESQEILAGLTRLESNLSSGQKQLTGKLRIAIPVDFGHSCIAPMIGDFSAQHPLVEIEVQMSDRFVDIVAEGFDLAIRVGKHADSSLVSRLITKADIWLVAAPSLFNDKEVPQSPDDLSKFPLLQDTNYRSGGIWRFRKNNKETRLVPTSRLNVNSAQAVRELAVRGHGLARCPGLFASADVEEGRLIRLLPDYEIQKGEVRVIFSSAKHMSQKVRRFTDFLAARFAELVT